jgi:hypothetical protein
VGVLCAIGGVLVLSYVISRVRACRLEQTLAQEDAVEAVRNVQLREWSAPVPVHTPLT